MADHEVFEEPNFVLQKGAVLPMVRLAYKTVGALNAARDNAVLVPSWYTGTHNDTEAFMLGETRALDPRRYLLTRHLGIERLRLVTRMPDLPVGGSVPRHGPRYLGWPREGWPRGSALRPRGSAPRVPACRFSAPTSLRVLSLDRRGGSGDTKALRCLSESSVPGG
jgi:hypothetical protein